MITDPNYTSQIVRRMNNEMDAALVELEKLRRELAEMHKNHPEASCADAFPKLRRENERLREALKAFVVQWDEMPDSTRRAANGNTDFGRLIRHARAALTRKAPSASRPAA